jgi:hypothetical protein
MPAIRRLSDTPYRWDIIEAPLSEVVNQEKLLPPRIHQRRRLRRHRGGPPVFGAAHRWRSQSTIQEWPARLCEAAERSSTEKTDQGVLRLKTATVDDRPANSLAGLVRGQLWGMKSGSPRQA